MKTKCIATTILLLATSAAAAAERGEARMLYEWKPEGGHKMNVTNNDPQFNLPGDVPRRIPVGATLTLRMAATAGWTVQIFWGGEFNETDSIRLPLQPDGKMHDYVFRFPRTITLDKLRLDPTDAPGNVHIERVAIEAADAPEIGVGAFYVDSALPRVGRAERVCALIDNTGRERGSVVASLALPAGVRLLGPAEQEAALGPDDVRLLSWQVQAEAPGEARFTLELSFKDGGRLSAGATARFAPAVKATKADYVPAPVPAKTEYLVGALHFPGWKQGTHYGWQRIVPFPERKPALGWYDENNPEVTDWEIKWAVEHGISHFVYCWYRNRANVGKPVAVDDLYLAHAIHEGFFRSRYRDKMKFSLLWEVANAGGVSSADDLLQNLVPFWIENYFKHPSYLKVDNKPLVFVFEWGSWQNAVAKPLGGTPDKVRAALDAARELCRKAGFDGLLWFVESRSPSDEWRKTLTENGLDGGFPYCWANGLTAHFGRSAPGMAAYLPVVSMGWNSAPWGNGWERGWRLGSGGRLSPEAFRAACAKVKEAIEALPAGNIGRRLVLVDNWNEWGEGHYVMPHRQYGFGYLDAIRSVFCGDPPEHEDITPEDVGLGPYDSRWQEFLKTETLGPHDAMIRELLK